MVTAHDVREALRKRFCQPEWSIFFEVANGTGGDSKRHADALTINMYPSRGLTILGFEIKVSTSDLMREISNPAKAEEIARFCDEWWLAVPEGLIKDKIADLIPRPWGVMELQGDKLRVTKKAVALNTQPITKSFLAAVLRSAGKLDEHVIKQAREEGKKQAYEWAKLDLERNKSHAIKELEAIKKGLAVFEEITGKSINEYTDYKSLGEAFKLAEDYNELVRKYGLLTSIRNMSKAFVDKTAFLEEIEKVS